MQLLFNLTILSFIIPCYFLGYVDEFIEADQTYLSVAIFFLTFIGLFASLINKWGTATLIEGLVPYLGLVGTVIGFVMTLSGIDMQALNAKQVGAQLAYGLGTALYTTLAGSIGYIWLHINRHYFHKISKQL